MVIALFFLLGLIVGSFLNVLVLRTNSGETLKGRSRCFSCLQKLAWYDLIPLASYFFIRGRCRYCGSAVSVQYPVVEFLTGVIFASIALVASPLEGELMVSGAGLVRYLLIASFFSLLLAASVYDIRHKIIPDQFSLALFGLAAGVELLALWTGTATLLPDAASALGAFLFFGGIWFVSGGSWMGFGDAKIALSLGLMLGYPGIVLCLLFAFWIGAIVAGFLLLNRSYGLKTEVPFAPFLAAGAYAAFLLIASDAFMVLYRYIMLI